MKKPATKEVVNPLYTLFYEYFNGWAQDNVEQSS